MAVEQTLAILKPDCVRKNLQGEVLARIQKAGFKVLGMRQLRLTQQTAGAFYAVHKGRPFYDELVGFITAVTYVRPSKSIDEVEVNSVKKKMKDKAFAKNVSREDITKGAELMNIPLEEHIQFCINAMKENRAELGL